VGVSRLAKQDEDIRYLANERIMNSQEVFHDNFAPL
jgi:hypothetical protein